MARARRQQRNDSNGESGNTTTTERTKSMAGLSSEQIAKLLGKTRQKGLYTEKLNEFIASQEMGVSVKETWVEMRDKKDTTLKQGFDNAKGTKEAAEGADLVKVVASKEDGDVYLINLALAGETAAEAA